MNRINKNLFEFLKNHQKVNITPQAIRNEISKIRSDNPGVTLNAAASIFAKKRGIRVMRYLSEDDSRSLKYSKETDNTREKRSRTKKVIFKPVTVKYGNKFINEANKNASIYPHIYILENSLRKLILETFDEENDWWEKRVNNEVKDYAKRIQKAEKKHDWLPKRGNHPIYYVGLYELFKIISKNYSTNFKNIFTDQGNLRTWINECVPIRNLLAHNVKVNSEERQNLIIRTKYICTLIEKNRNKYLS